jgi:hypothetical protein
MQDKNQNDVVHGNRASKVSRGHNLDFDTRVTTGEKEIPKIRADVFFRLKQGEFMMYADGKDKRVEFKSANIQRALQKDSIKIQRRIWRLILREFKIKLTRYLINSKWLTRISNKNEKKCHNLQQLV